MVDAGPRPVTPPASCRVMVKALRVMADIGAHDREIGVLQPLIVSVRAEIRPPTHDDLKQTFDYTRIVTFAEQLASQRTVLLETFAQRLASMCLESDAVTGVEVSVDKPDALPDCLAGVCLHQTKG